MRPNTAMMRHDLIFVLGGPGSGKGTLCARLAADCGARHLSVGDLLRGAPDLQAGLQAGHLAPSERVVALLLGAMPRGSRYIVDGFPRTAENRRVFEARTSWRPDRVLFLDCPTHILWDRLMGRNRADDSPDAIHERLRIFEQQTMPVVRSYECVHINADQSPERVFEDARHALGTTAADAIISSHIANIRRS